MLHCDGTRLELYVKSRYQHWYVEGREEQYCFLWLLVPERKCESLFFQAPRLWFRCCLWVAGNRVRDIRANEQMRIDFWMDVFDTSLLLKMKDPCGAIWGIKKGNGNNWLIQIGSHVRLQFDSHPWHSCYPFRSAVSLDRSFNWVKKSRKCSVQYWPIMVLVCIAAFANIDVQRGSQVNLPARYSKQRATLRSNVPCHQLKHLKEFYYHSKQPLTKAISASQSWNGVLLKKKMVKKKKKRKELCGCGKPEVLKL